MSRRLTPGARTPRHGAWLLSLLIGPTAAGSSGWPADVAALQDRLPSDIRIEPVAQRLEFNGTPMRLQIWHAPWPATRLAQWLQSGVPAWQRLDRPQGPLLQRWQAGQLTSIAIETIQRPHAPPHSRAVVTALDWSTPHSAGTPYGAVQHEWQQRLPPGSVLRQLIRSWDHGQETVWLLADNPWSASHNRAHLLAQLQRIGLRPDPSTAPTAAAAGGQTTFMSGATGQTLSLSLQAAPTGSTVVLIQHTRPTSAHTP